MKKWSQMFGCAVGVISLYIFLVYFFDWETTKRLLGNTQVLPVCWSTFFFFITLFLRAFKWTFILKRKNHVTWRNGYHTIMISNMVNFVFPIRFGEILKLYIIKKVANISYPSSVSATLVDRASQLLIILLLLFFTPPAGFVFSQWSSRFILVFIAFVILSICLFAFGVRLLDIIANWLKGLLLLLRLDQDKVKHFSEGKSISFCRESLEKMNISEFSKWDLLIILLLSFVIISVDGICYYFIINAFGVPITLLQGTLAACFMQLLFILPAPPGQAGTAEMYPVLIFSWGLGMASSIISSAALLWHLLTTVVFIMLGVCSAASLGVGLGSMLHDIRDQKIQEKTVGVRD